MSDAATRDPWCEDCQEHHHPDRYKVAKRLRAFRLARDTDVSGVSGTGYVAEGVEFSDGTVALRWLSDWPTSVVFHDRGIEAVKAVHGHGGATRIEWLDGPDE